MGGTDDGAAAGTESSAGTAATAARYIGRLALPRARSTASTGAAAGGNRPESALVARAVSFLLLLNYRRSSRSFTTGPEANCRLGGDPWRRLVLPTTSQPERSKQIRRL